MEKQEVYRFRIASGEEVTVRGGDNNLGLLLDNAPFLTRNTNVAQLNALNRNIGQLPEDTLYRLIWMGISPLPELGMGESRAKWDFTHRFSDLRRAGYKILPYSALDFKQCKELYAEVVNHLTRVGEQYIPTRMNEIKERAETQPYRR